MSNIGEKLEEGYISLKKWYDKEYDRYNYAYEFTSSKGFIGGLCYGGFNMFLDSLQLSYRKLSDTTHGLLIKEKGGIKFEEQEITDIKNVVNKEIEIKRS